MIRLKRAGYDNLKNGDFFSLLEVLGEHNLHDSCWHCLFFKITVLN